MKIYFIPESIIENCIARGFWVTSTFECKGQTMVVTAIGRAEIRREKRVVPLKLTITPESYSSDVIRQTDVIEALARAFAPSCTGEEFIRKCKAIVVHNERLKSQWWGGYKKSSACSTNRQQWETKTRQHHMSQVKRTANTNPLKDISVAEFLALCRRFGLI